MKLSCAHDRSSLRVKAEGGRSLSFGSDRRAEPRGRDHRAHLDRGRRRGDARDLQAPCPARPRRLRPRAAPPRRHQAPPQEHAQAQAAPSRRRADGRDRRLCVCGAVPQAAGLSLCREAFDLRAPRSSAFRRRPPSAAGTDRCLRYRRVPPDDRLYRFRRRAVEAPARGVRLRACRNSQGRGL